MKKRPEPPATDDEAIEQVAQALAKAGDLMPTTEDAVAREEELQAEQDVELPASLRSFKPQTSARVAPSTSKVVDLKAARQAKTPWLNYAAATLLGAAAASVLFLTRHEPVEPPVGIGPSGESSPPVRAPDTADRQLSLAALSCDSDCCAGSACAKATQALAECPSGRSCIRCNGPDASERYRLRLGTLALSAAGLRARTAGNWQGLEVCMRVGSSDRTCVPAHAGGDDAATWTSLPLVASVQDGLAGFEVEVRAEGEVQPVAAWRGPVAVNPTVLCKGLSLQPKLGSDVFGTVSLFLDDTHFVELERAKQVRPLEEYRRRFRGKIRPKVFEVATQPATFALSIGPLSHAAAERMRWQLLEQGAQPTLVLGLDYDSAQP